jgi:hypothetical protein
MNIKLKLFYALALLVSITSCKDFNPNAGPKIEPCDFSVKDNIIVNDIALKAPEKMSNAFYSGIPSDKTIRNLLHAMWDGNYSSSNKGKISGTLKSSGKTCTGESTFAYNADDSRIGIDFLEVNLPSKVNFLGSLSLTIRSDDYRDENNPSIAEYVLWSGSGNDPAFNGVNGKIQGAKKSLNSTTGRLRVSRRSVRSSSIIRSGTRTSVRRR